MKIQYGTFTQTGRYEKYSGEVVSMGEKTGEQQIITYRDRSGIEHKVNVLSPHVKNLVITKDLATIEWFPYDNPTRFTAKLLKAGAQRPETIGSFRGEKGIEEAEAAIRAQSPDPDFVLPARFAENVACLNPRDDRMYFDRHGN